MLPTKQTKPAAIIHAVESSVNSRLRAGAEADGQQPQHRGAVDGHAAPERHGPAVQLPLAVGPVDDAPPPRQRPHRRRQQQRRREGHRGLSTPTSSSCNPLRKSQAARRIRDAGNSNRKQSLWRKRESNCCRVEIGRFRRRRSGGPGPRKRPPPGRRARSRKYTPSSRPRSAISPKLVLSTGKPAARYS